MPAGMKASSSSHKPARCGKKFVDRTQEIKFIDRIQEITKMTVQTQSIQPPILTQDEPSEQSEYNYSKNNGK